MNNWLEHLRHYATPIMIACLVAIAFLSSPVFADHSAEWFRSTPSGMHNALDYSRPLTDQVEATTCLPDAFVRVNGNKFQINGKDFVFAGWNQWEMMEAVSNAGPPARHLPLPGREHVVRLMNEGVRNGLKLIRVWAHTISEGNEVQKKPGVWDEEALQGFDFFLDEARKRRLKILIVLADNWYTVGGVDQYVEWSNTASRHQDFYTDDTAQRIFKRMIEKITTRRNTINGRIYGEDPTIFGYNLVNEARCQNCPRETIGRWMNEMCQHLKRFAPNHLVGLGYEGFFHSDDDEELRNLNPGVGSDWAAREGQSWYKHTQIPCIDYSSVHSWPDNWQPKTVEFQRRYIQTHIDLAAKIGKPFILEEFGKKKESSTFAERDRYMRDAFDVAERAAYEGKLAGTIFWHWYDRGIGLTSSYGIHSDESTFAIIQEHVRDMNAITGARAYCPLR